jgi:hypothetical protein
MPLIFTQQRIFHHRYHHHQLGLHANITRNGLNETTSGITSTVITRILSIIIIIYIIIIISVR